MLCSMRHWSICELSGTHPTGRLGCIGPTLPRHRRDDTAGTPGLNHHHNYRRTALIQVMTTGWTELLEDGHRHRRRRGSTTLSSLVLLKAGWSSGWTGSTPRRADCQCKTTRPFGSRVIRCTGLGANSLCSRDREARAGTVQPRLQCTFQSLLRC